MLLIETSVSPQIPFMDTVLLQLVNLKSEERLMSEIG